MLRYQILPEYTYRLEQRINDEQKLKGLIYCLEISA